MRTENPNSLQEQSHALLQCWVEREGKHATGKFSFYLFHSTSCGTCQCNISNPVIMLVCLKILTIILSFYLDVLSVT